MSELKAGDKVDGRVLYKHSFVGWRVDIGATKQAFLEFEEGHDGFPPQKMNTWRHSRALDGLDVTI